MNKKHIADLAAVKHALREELSRNSEVAAHLYADQAVDYGRVAEVMAAMQHSGISKMGFITVD